MTTTPYGHPVTARAFKSAWFSRAANKARISDSELCEAFHQVLKGQAENLGGGVFKKRLNDNMHRSIILAKGGAHWIYEFLFSKQDRSNITQEELESFRSLAKTYGSCSTAQIEHLLHTKILLEICHGDQIKIQK